MIAAPRQLSPRAEMEAPTPREAAAFALLCQGMSQKEIARELGVTRSRVEQYFASLREKTHTRTNAGMVARMVERAS